MRAAVSYLLSALFHGAVIGLMAALVPRELPWDFAVDQGEAIMLSASLAAAPPPTPAAVEIEITHVPASQHVPLAAATKPTDAPAEKQTTTPPVEIVEHGELPETLTSIAESVEVERQAEAQPVTVAAAATPTTTPTRQPSERPTPSTATTASLAQRQVRNAGANVDQPPRKMPSNPAPHYPLEARLGRFEGVVMLRVEIDANGSVAGLVLHRSSGYEILDESALSAVRGWRFYPARDDGHSVAAEVLVPVRFSIRDR